MATTSPLFNALKALAKSVRHLLAAPRLSASYAVAMVDAEEALANAEDLLKSPEAHHTTKCTCMLWLQDQERKAAKLTTATLGKSWVTSDGLVFVRGTINHVTLGTVTECGTGLTIEDAVKDLNLQLARAIRDLDSATKPATDEECDEAVRISNQATDEGGAP